MLLDVMNKNITLVQYLDFTLRLLLACVCGAAIGIERGHRLKEAGVRTHLLVCCTAALIIIISKYGFADLSGNSEKSMMGDRGADPSRIAAQVVSGISFLCAGVIFKQGATVKGLTTAAGLWATAGIGLALGAGMLPLGIIATVVVVLSQIIMHLLPFLNDKYLNTEFKITVRDDLSFREALTRQLQEWHAQVFENSITHNPDGTTTYSLALKMSNQVKREDVFAFLEHNSEVISFRQTING